MKLLDKYILRSYLVPLAYCVIAFNMIFVVWDLFDHMAEFLESATPVRLILLYYAYLILPTMDFLLPASLLLATLYTLWHFTRSNELTAMRASGISLFRIMIPFLFVGFLASLGATAVKETIAVRTTDWLESFKRSHFVETAHDIHVDVYYFNRMDRRVWEITQFDRSEPFRLNGLTIKDEREDGSTERKIVASKAEWLDGQWWLFDAQLQKYLVNEMPDGKETPLPPVYEMRGFTETPEDFVIETGKWELLSTVQMIRYLERHPDLSPEAISQKRFDVHSRLAMPWACFIVTLFGIPTGARSGRQSVLTGIFVAMACFFGFYALSQVGLFLGKRRIIYPWLGAWLSNIVFLLSGIFMVRRMR